MLHRQPRPSCCPPEAALLKRIRLKKPSVFTTLCERENAVKEINCVVSKKPLILVVPPPRTQTIRRSTKRKTPKQKPRYMQWYDKHAQSDDTLDTHKEESLEQEHIANDLRNCYDALIARDREEMDRQPPDVHKDIYRLETIFADSDPFSSHSRLMSQINHQIERQLEKTDKEHTVLADDKRIARELEKFDDAVKQKLNRRRWEESESQVEAVEEEEDKVRMSLLKMLYLYKVREKRNEALMKRFDDILDDGY